MMNINVNSWHYKLIANWRDCRIVPNSLCPYIRALLVSLFEVSAICLGLTTLLGYVGYCLFTTLLTILFPEWWGMPKSPEALATGFIVMILLTIVAVVYLVHLAQEKWDFVGKIERIGQTRYKPKEPTVEDESSIWNVLRKYRKAIHDKVCPTISFTD